MRKNKTLVAVVLSLALLATAVGGVATYTTFTADRSASINVVTDSNSPTLELSPTAESAFVTQTGGNGDNLAINVSETGANGVNDNAVLKIGDSADLTNKSAFHIVNHYNESRTVSLSYTATTDGSTAANVQFDVYAIDSTGTVTQVASASEEADASFTASSGKTYYVVMTIDTTASGTTSGDDLSGTLTVNASA